jgi:hypothetical protein
VKGADSGARREVGRVLLMLVAWAYSLGEPEMSVERSLSLRWREDQPFGKFGKQDVYKENSGPTACERSLQDYLHPIALKRFQ